MFRFSMRTVAGAAAASSAGTCSSATQSCRSQLRHSSSAKKRDFYEVLGVSKTASDSEIKKAYRQRAMATHPDKGGNKEEFAAVSEAYEVLSTPEKRQMYDRYGADAATSAGGPGGFPGGRSAEDIFQDFFRNMGGGGFGGGGGGPAQVEDIDVKLTLTLEDVYNGAAKSVHVRRPASCGECKGEGTKQPGQKRQCTKCNGSGRVVQRVSLGPGMVQQVVNACNACDGSGQTIRHEDRCTKCRGEGFVTNSDTVSINVPAGLPEGAVVVMQGAGGTKPGMQPGNLNVHLEILPHRQFKRRGDDLILERNVSLVEALTGLHLRVTMPDGRTIVVASEEGKPLKHDGVIAVMQEGLPKYQRPGRGHLYVVTKIVMPSNLTPDQKSGLEKLFGAAHREKDTAGLVTGKNLRESIGELEQAKAAEWSRQDGGGGGGSRRRGGQPEGAQCQQM